LPLENRSWLSLPFRHIKQPYSWCYIYFFSRKRYRWFWHKIGMY